MDSRERVSLSLSHVEPDRVPLDLGSSAITGMHVERVYALRQALELDPPGTPVKVVEPYQMLGEIAPDLIAALGIDVVGLNNNVTMFGFRNEDWKRWDLHDGTPVLVPRDFNTETDDFGNVLMYPNGDKTSLPCAKMPKGGFYFDALDRQLPINWKNLDPKDNLEEFNQVTNDDLDFLRKESERLYTRTDKAIFGSFGGSSFGDIALVPGLQLRKPTGIRGVKEWYMCHVTRPDYVLQVFAKQCDIVLENLEKIFLAVGNKVAVAFVTGTDFGGQKGPLLSNRTYEKLYKPFHKRVNDWIHEHTSWKTFIHSCGSVEPLMREFVQAGFDILNPVQTSAENMIPQSLKSKYGDKIVFWGGGIDTQQTLPFGNASQVKKEVCRNMQIFAKGGGFVFNTVHNVQPMVPLENILAMYEAVRQCGKYNRA